MKTIEYNVLVLAYLGDTVYEQYIRKHLISIGISNVNDLQKESIKYVSARAQASYMKELVEVNLLTEKELDVFKRARNYKSNSHPKNTDLNTYKIATGFESLIGYLELENKKERIEEIINFILGDK